MRSRPRTDGVAIAALVVGAASLVLFFLFLPAAAAIVLGIVAALRIGRSEGVRGRGLAAAGIGLGLVSLLIGVMLVVVLARSGALGGRLVTYSRLQIGDCFNEPSGFIPLYHRVLCTHGHDREVYGRFLDPSTSGAGYPGTAALQAEAAQQCPRLLIAYLGPNPGRSPYAEGSVVPAAGAWSRGARVILCVLRAPDGFRLTVPARPGLA